MTLSGEIIVAILAGLAGVIGGVVGAYAALRKLPLERRKLQSEATQEEAGATEREAGAAEKWEGIAGRAATRIADMEENERKAKDRIDGLERRVIVLEGLLQLANERIDALECDNGDLREWAARLVFQVASLGGQPVPIVHKKDRREEGD